jgi:predicted MFS family arabinose efflux permease
MAVTRAAGQGSGYRYVVLGLLIVAYTFNFLDRQILGILAGAIKADLGLTDSQLGLMGGLAFALFYTALGVPIAWLADRWSRTWIMTGALAVWSGFTALCGAATGFWPLFLCRMGWASARPAGWRPPIRSSPITSRRASGRGPWPPSRSAYRWAARWGSCSAG